MAWVKLDDSFATHPKVLSLCIADRLFHLAAMCWSAAHHTNGRIPQSALGAIAACCVEPVDNESDGNGGAIGEGIEPEWDGSKSPIRPAQRLVKARLWEVDISPRGRRQGAWHIHDWDLYNPDAEESKSLRDEGMRLRQKWREDKRRQRAEKRVSTTKSTDVHQRQSTGLSAPRARGTRPVPSPEDGTSISRPLLGEDIGDVQATAFGPEGARPPGGSQNGQDEHPPAPLSDDLVQAMAGTSSVMAQLLERRRLADLAAKQEEWAEKREPSEDEKPDE